MAFVNWVIDSLASEDVIDLYCVLTDIVDIVLTPLDRARLSWGGAASDYFVHEDATGRYAENENGLHMEVNHKTNTGTVQRWHTVDSNGQPTGEGIPSAKFVI